MFSRIFLFKLKYELLPRVELGTSSLPRMRSTTELKQQHFVLASAKLQLFFDITNFSGLFCSNIFDLWG